jgi:hypothetical protein
MSTDYGRLERLATQAESYVIVLDGEHVNVGAVIRALYTDHRRLCAMPPAQGVEFTRERALEAVLRKLVNSIWMDGKGADNIVNRAAYDAARATLSALAMTPAQGEFTRGWEAGRDAAWRAIHPLIGNDLKGYDCQDAGEGYDFAINQAVETIQYLIPPAPEACHE